MKTCPFCAEEIQDAAIVCKHCGRELTGGTVGQDMKTCPFCAEEIQDAAIVCKHCGRELTGGTVGQEKTPPEYDDVRALAGVKAIQLLRSKTGHGDLREATDYVDALARGETLAPLPAPSQSAPANVTAEIAPAEPEPIPGTGTRTAMLVTVTLGSVCLILALVLFLPTRSRVEQEGERPQVQEVQEALEAVREATPPIPDPTAPEGEASNPNCDLTGTWTSVLYQLPGQPAVTDTLTFVHDGGIWYTVVMTFDDGSSRGVRRESAIRAGCRLLEQGADPNRYVVRENGEISLSDRDGFIRVYRPQ